jgi:hypothetical protein
LASWEFFVAHLPLQRVIEGPITFLILFDLIPLTVWL